MTYQRTPFLRLALTLAGALSCASQFAFAEITPSKGVAIEDRILGADQVIRGKVRETRSFHHRTENGDDLIMTNVIVEVAENLKGAASSQVELQVEGGTVDGITLKVSDLPEMKAGEEVVAFLSRTRDGFKPFKRGLGILKIDSINRRVKNSSLTLDMIREKARFAR